MAFRVPERYRVQLEGGHRPSAPGDPFGAFAFKYQGTTLRMIAAAGEGWEHVSVSTPKRVPTWDEMALVKRLFWEPEDVVMQLHPAQSQYVNCHPYVLHLWRPTDAEIPTPPIWMV